MSLPLTLIPPKKTKQSHTPMKENIIVSMFCGGFLEVRGFKAAKSVRNHTLQLATH